MTDIIKSAVALAIWLASLALTLAVIGVAVFGLLVALAYLINWMF